MQSQSPVVSVLLLTILCIGALGSADDPDELVAGMPSHEAFELVREPLARIPRLIAGREITHALVVAAFQLLDTEQPG